MLIVNADYDRKTVNGANPIFPMDHTHFKFIKWF